MLSVTKCMKEKFESLEKKLDKPDWRQLLPIYGIYQGMKDAMNGKPNFMQERTEHEIRETKPTIFYGNIIYQTISVFAAYVGITYGLSKLAEKLF